MSKRECVIGLVFLLVLSGIISASSTTNLKIGDTNYEIEMTYMDASSLRLNVNGETGIIDTVQSSQPYYTTKIGGLDFILRDIVYQDYVGGRQEATIWIGKEIGFSQSPTIKLTEEIEFDGISNTIELSYLNYDEIRLVVNGENSGRVEGKQETPPYYIENYAIGTANIQGLDIVVRDIKYQQFVGGIQNATLLIGKDKVLSLPVTQPTSNCFGNTCTLYEGQNITYGGHEFKSIFIGMADNKGTVKLSVDGESTNSLNEGNTEVIGDIKISIGEIFVQDFVGVINYVTFTFEEYTPPLKSSCSGNICTLYEGESITQSGYDFEIAFISATEVKLKLDGTYTNSLNEGNTEVIGDIKIGIDDIFYQGYVGGTKYVIFSVSNYTAPIKSSCEDSTCTLYEGESIISEGHEFKLIFIGGVGTGNEVRLNVDGELTGSLTEGNTEVIGDIKIIINNIVVQDYAGGVKYVIFSFEKYKQSSCSEDTCTLYEGGNITFEGNEFKLIFIGGMGTGAEVKLNVNGESTNSLSEGESQVIGNLKIYIDDIVVQDYAGGTKYVVFMMIDIKDCDGCVLNDKCYPLGYRKRGEYCSDYNEFVEQVENGGFCDNNFECRSNVCVEDECISGSIIKKIINWFRRIILRE